MTHRIRIFLAAFLFSIHLALVSYLNVIFLKNSFSSGVVDFLFIAGSVGACIFSLITPRATARLGVIRSSLLLFICSSVGLVILGTAKGKLLIASAFVFYFLLNSSILSLVDVALEHYSPRKLIGNIRGFYLALTSTAWFVANACNTYLLKLLPLRTLYVLAGGIVLLASLSLFRLEQVFHNPKHQAFRIKDIAHTWKTKPRIRKIYISAFVLQLFYAIMVIFSAFFLRDRFSLSTIAGIFTVMLLPFVIFQYPIGKICDKYPVARKLIFWSFSVMTISVFLFIAYLPVGSVVTIAAILFLSRSGASIAEVAIECEFFRITSDEDTAAISVYRALSPISYIFAPIIGILLLHRFEGIFSVLLVLLALTTLYLYPKKERVSLVQVQG